MDRRRRDDARRARPHTMATTTTTARASAGASARARATSTSRRARCGARGRANRRDRARAGDALGIAGRESRDATTRRASGASARETRAVRDGGADGGADACSTSSTRWSAECGRWGTMGGALARAPALALTLARRRARGRNARSNAVSDSEASKSESGKNVEINPGMSQDVSAWLFEEDKKIQSNANGANGVGDAAEGAQRVREGSSRHERHAGHYLSKPYAVYRIDAAGQRVPYKQIMTRRQLLRDTDLSPRDLRRIDPTLGQTTNTPAVIVREDSVLVNLGVRIIICADHALLLEPDTMMSMNFLEAWTQRQNNASTQSGSDGMEVLPFELMMVEAALQETCAQLENRLEHCARRYRALERKLQTGIEKTTFDEMRFMKQALVQLESRASAVRDELLETLDDEDDIERMTLSSKATGEAKAEEQEEVENLLEYYVQQTEAVHGATEALLENTRDLDESISVTLSARRLEVSKIELMLSIASFAAAIGAVVTGIFGMNLTSTFESSVKAFYLCTALLISSCIGMSAWLYRLCRRRNIL